MPGPVNSVSMIRFAESVVHPTDFSSSSHTAFVHGLAIALLNRTRFDILHVGDKTDRGWTRFPAVRGTLESWGLLEPGSEQAAVFDEFSVNVKKVRLVGDPARETLDYIRKGEPDLLVLATEGRRGLARWLVPSIGQDIARRSRTMTLFVSEGGAGFVSAEKGRLSLRRILIPIDRSPDASEAIIKAVRLAEAVGDAPVEISVLHVGSGAFPDYRRPEGEFWRWGEIRRTGDVDDEIISVADLIAADLIVMATDGRNGVLDGFRGSFTERVVRRTARPVLAVPAPT